MCLKTEEAAPLPALLPIILARCPKEVACVFTSSNTRCQAGLLPSSPRGNPACRGTFGGRRKAVRDRLALQGGTGDFP